MKSVYTKIKNFNINILMKKYFKDIIISKEIKKSKFQI